MTCFGPLPPTPQGTPPPGAPPHPSFPLRSRCPSFKVGLRAVIGTREALAPAALLRAVLSG